MTNHANESATRKIYIKDLHQWVPVSKTEFDNYYRDINTYRRRQQEHGRCICPANKRYLCDMDCGCCPFHKGGDELSLDYTVTDEDGNEKSWLDDVADDTPSIQSVLEDRDLLNALHAHLDELDPDGHRICSLIMQGCPERTAAAKLGLSRNTYTYRRDKLLTLLREALRDYI
jgi:hypothetical protein